MEFEIEKTKAGFARNPNCTDIIRKILVLNNNGGNDVETRHALSLQNGCQNIFLFFLTDFQE